MSEYKMNQTVTVTLSQNEGSSKGILICKCTEPDNHNAVILVDKRPNGFMDGI